MKTLLLIFAFAFFTLHAQSKVVYLNNNLAEPNIAQKQYNNWTDAYASVSAGDTIYVIGSNTNYGGVTIDKTLTVIGPGYFLDENRETQVDKKVAKINDLTFATGSVGSLITGMTITGHSSTSIDIRNVDNIKINNCHVQRLYIYCADGTVYNNIEVINCFFSGRIDYGPTSGDGICTNLIISNNIINYSIYIPTGSTGIITHNLFLSNTLIFGTSSSFEIANNIFINEDADDFTIQPLPDASVHHNISITGVFGDANNNFTAPESTLFTTDENASSDGMYQLSENSPAKGAGKNGVDIGPFGGPNPYRLSGLPNLPNIYELSTGGLVSGNELPVHIKIKQQ